MSEIQPHQVRAAGGGYEVLSNVRLSPNVNRLEVSARRIAHIRQPVQFVIVHIGPGAERIPLTIADANIARGSITLIVQAVGKTTCELVGLMPGEVIQDVVGPLGRPTELIREGRAVCVGGGTGLRVEADVDTRPYPIGVKISDKELAAVPLQPHDWHPNWNNSILPP
jgi:NAD(P)H-flavin reductase